MTYMKKENKARRLPKASATLVKDAPTIILINPQLGENIGMAARAMLNNALGCLRLVAPVHGWPNEHAIKPSAGAEVILDAVEVFDETKQAVADLSHVYATTARDRDMTKRVLTANAAANEMRCVIEAGGKPGVIFGRESWGLSNDDVALADTIVTIPMNPAFSSLNLAQAVLLIGYEWFQSREKTKKVEACIPKNTRLANKYELVCLFEHLEMELDNCGFLRPPEKRPTMVNNIRNIFQRANMTEQEVRTFRGIISGLVRHHERS